MFYSCQGQEFFIFFKKCKPALGPTRPALSWDTGSSLAWVKRLWLEVAASLHLEPRLRMGGRL
jgi:hypothetical protein